MLKKRLAAVIAVAGLVPGVAFAEGMSAWLAEINLLWSSFKITTRQASVSSDKVSTVKLQAAQAASSAVLDVYNRGQVRQIWNDYGPTGQLVDPCYQLALADTSATIKSRTDASTQNAAALVYSTSDGGSTRAAGAAGLFGGMEQRTTVPYAGSVGQRVQRHQQKYCSVSEAGLGFCNLTPNGMQSGDSDFSLHVTPGKTFGWDQAEAATDFVKTVAPVKPQPVQRGCTSVECQAVLRARRESEAYMSMARYSFLQFVESRTTQAIGDAKQAVKK